MDPITVPTLAAVLSAAVGGAAGQAGGNAWEALSSFVRARFGRDSPATETLDSVDRRSVDPTGNTPHTDTTASTADTPLRELAVLLVDRAETDAEFASWLRSWLAGIAESLPEHARPPTGSGPTAGRADGSNAGMSNAEVSNSVGGDVHGHTVQARDIHGSIDLGGHRDR